MTKRSSPPPAAFWVQLAFSGASFALALATVLAGSTKTGNGWPVGARVAVLGAGLFGAAFALAFGRYWSRRAEGSLEDAARLTGPLLIAAALPALFERSFWVDRELALLIYALAVGLAAERLLTRALRALPETLSRDLAPPRWLVRAHWLPLALVLLGVAAYVLRVGHLTEISHARLQTSSSDLAEFDNLFFNALHGHPFRAPAIEGELRDWSALKVHAEFGLYFLLPFYALAPGPVALLWIQTALVGATALPLALLAARVIGRWGSVVVAWAYLLTPAVQRPNFYDFHFTPLGMFWIAWLFVALAHLHAQPKGKKQQLATYALFGLALLSREDVSLGLAVLGLFLYFGTSLRRVGVQFLVVSTAYFLVVKFIVMPRFGTMWFDTMYEDLKAPGVRGFSSVILTLTTNPAFVLRSLFTEPKLLYLLHMIVPALALWVRRPLLLLALLPGFVSTLLVTNRPPLFQSSFQYTYLWLPYVFGASVLGLRFVKERKATLFAWLLVAAGLSRQMGVFPTGDRILGGFVERTFSFDEAAAKNLEDLHALVALIPPEASVTATEAEGPHVSTRLVMYSLKFTLGDEPDFLLVRAPSIRSERDHLRRAQTSGRYTIAARRGAFTLWRRIDAPDPAVESR